MQIPTTIRRPSSWQYARQIGQSADQSIASGGVKGRQCAGFISSHQRWIANYIRQHNRRKFAFAGHHGKTIPITFLKAICNFTITFCQYRHPYEIGAVHCSICDRLQPGKLSVRHNHCRCNWAEHLIFQPDQDGKNNHRRLANHHQMRLKCFPIFYYTVRQVAVNIQKH